jgi:hypothetical protein
MTAEQLHFLGFRALRLRNSQLEVVVVPELGGRILSLSFRGHEFLFNNPALHGKLFSFEEHARGESLRDWKNYGGDKTWPAPQGWQRDDEWPGPPDPYLDSGVYTSDLDGRGIVMTSPIDPRTGLRIERRIELDGDSTELLLSLTFTNCSHRVGAARTSRWAIWNVAQLDCAASSEYWLYMAAEHQSGWDASYRVLYGQDNPAYLRQLNPDLMPGVLAVNYRGEVGKVGTRSRRNWLAFRERASGRVLTMRATFNAAAEYPDGGCALECWTEAPGARSPVPLASPGRILEAEVLGPLTQLEPGQSCQLSLRYGMTHCFGAIRDVTEMGCVALPLGIRRYGEHARVTGRVGVFRDATLVLEYVGASDVVAEQRALATVTAGSHLDIDLPVPAERAGTRARLRWRAGCFE